MANKRLLHHLWIKLKPINAWYFLIACLLFTGIAVWALRENNLKMIELRDEVIAADEAGEGVDEALAELRQHVHSHMNADLSGDDTSIYPPLQLRHTYERLKDKNDNEEVAQHNRQVAKRAATVCENRHGPGSLDQRVQCVETYITQNSLEEKEEVKVPKELYQFAFVSPVWSPDLAGWSIVLAVLFFTLFTVRFTLERWLRYQLHNHL
ncbi:MAG: hypothetical protein U5K77_02255 [Candidatus Saccharibacteria bacterium]|nr:hypothetical protein [Candidatus Saccharibacteria bacterium]